LTQSSIYKEQPKEEIIRLELELTAACNLQCPLCLRTTHSDVVSKSKKRRSYEDIVAQLDEYPNLEFVTIAGAISEPTSHPDLFNILKYLKNRDIEISLYINGDARDNSYYIKLGTIFRGCKGHIYFTMAGYDQELHAKYRVGSDLERITTRLDLVNRYSGNKGIMTWLIFNYNQQDFEENYQIVKDMYNTEFFYTLPVQEHYELDQQKIHLPDDLHEIYIKNIDRNDYPTECTSNKNNFIQILNDGTVTPCSLYRVYGEKHCWECSEKNSDMLRKNKIYNIAESETETSEIPMRLYYDNP